MKKNVKGVKKGKKTRKVRGGIGADGSEVVDGQEKLSDGSQMGVGEVPADGSQSAADASLLKKDKEQQAVVPTVEQEGLTRTNTSL
jgi:hypothetical protein